MPGVRTNSFTYRYAVETDRQTDRQTEVGGCPSERRIDGLTHQIIDSGIKRCRLSPKFYSEFLAGTEECAAVARYSIKTLDMVERARDANNKPSMHHATESFSPIRAFRAILKFSTMVIFMEISSNGSNSGAEKRFNEN